MAYSIGARALAAICGCLLLLAGTACASVDVPPATAATNLPAPAEPPLPPDLPTGKQVMENSVEIARLIAELEAKQKEFGKRPRRKFISASVRQPEYADYMRAWVEKVERTGNANFPEEVRRQNLAGKVVVTAGINRDGSLREVLVNLSSGHRLLDEAAMDAVRKSAPFSPLPVNEEDIDILEITRTFEYKNGPPPSPADGRSPAKTP